MAYGQSNPSKWIIGALCLGLAAGLVWALVETSKRKPKRQNFVRMPPKKTVEPTPPPKKTQTPAPTPRTPQTPVQPARAPSNASQMTDTECEYLSKRVERLLKKGDLAQARKRLGEIKMEQVPETFLKDFRAVEDRLFFYLRMIGETSKGRLVEPPPLHRFNLTHGSEITAKLVTSDDKSYYIETLIGIATKLAKKRVKTDPKQLERYEVEVVLENQLKTKCGSKGIVMEMKSDVEASFFDNPHRRTKPLAMNYFDMAEFCVENGLNRHITALIDQAHKKDANLANSVHETKAKRLIDMLQFLAGIDAKEDMMDTFALLNSRYHDTRSYDMSRSWLREKFGGAVREKVKPKPKPIPQPIAKAPPRSPSKTIESGRKHTPSRTPSRPSSGAPNSGYEKVRAERYKKQQDAWDGWEREYGGPTSVAEAQKRTQRGDQFYKSGKKHLHNSDQGENPNGWADENIKALQFMNKAFEEYDIAQIIYERMGRQPPYDLRNKARETNMIRAMCRKRAVAGRH